MTYPSPDFPQIALQPGIFTPPGVLAAIEDPDQTAGKAKVQGKWILPSDLGSWMYHPWNPMVKTLRKIRLNVTNLKIWRKKWRVVWFLQSFLLMSSNPITKTYNKKVTSCWISCDGPCGPSHTKKRPRFGSKQCTWLRISRWKCLESKILQAATCTSQKMSFSLFVF